MRSLEFLVVSGGTRRQSAVNTLDLATRTSGEIPGLQGLEPAILSTILQHTLLPDRVTTLGNFIESPLPKRWSLVVNFCDSGGQQVAKTLHRSGQAF